MGHILDKVKKETLLKFESQKFYTDIEQKIDDDGLGFTIVRFNGCTLRYNGTIGEYQNNKNITK